MSLWMRFKNIKGLNSQEEMSKVLDQKQQNHVCVQIRARSVEAHTTATVCTIPLVVMMTCP